MNGKLYDDNHTDFEPPLKEEWMDKAACVGKEDLFFAEYLKDLREAVKICVDDCEVQNECLIYTMLKEKSYPGRRYGVAGGLLPRHRQQLAKVA